MAQIYQDFMAITQELDKPLLFVTVIANLY